MCVFLSCVGGMNREMESGRILSMKDLIYSLLLGLVQGLTEFLPVSSSGHLAIFKIIFGMEDVGI